MVFNQPHPTHPSKVLNETPRFWPDPWFWSIFDPPLKFGLFEDSGQKTGFRGFRQKVGLGRFLDGRRGQVLGGWVKVGWDGFLVEIVVIP